MNDNCSIITNISSAELKQLKAEVAAKHDDTRLAGLKEALALAAAYHQVGLVDYEAELARIIKRLEQAGHVIGQSNLEDRLDEVVEAIKEVNESVIDVRRTIYEHGR